LIDFLVTRSKTFKDEMPEGYDKRHPPTVRPSADNPLTPGETRKVA
jgi:nitrate/nitrite transport system ATP-binding protein